MRNRQWVIGPGLACASLLALAPLSLTGQPFDPEPFEPQVQTRVIRTGGSFLGVGLQEVDSDRARELKLREEAGVEITRVEEGSPAEKAGLKVGDVVLQYNGQRVEGMEQLSRLVRETPVGRQVKLLISRGGAQQTMTAKLEARKMPGAGVIQMPRIEIGDRHIQLPQMPDMPSTFMMWRSSMLGVEGEALKGQLAEFFGVKEGVLVRSVVKDTPAEKAGIKAGDVILKVNDVKVGSPGDISGALRSLQGKTSVPVVVLRDKREMILNATIESDKSGWDLSIPAIRISRPGGPVRL